MLARTRFDPDPRTVAALERVRLLVDDIDADAALALLDSGPLVRPIPWAVHELRSRLLLRIGRIDEALAAFDSCMSRDNIQESFGRILPRNLSALESSVSEEPAARTH